jgi:uncharacterized protein
MINLIITSFLFGILGSFHCFSMCGSIINIFNLNFSKKDINNINVIQFYYNIGRIISYGILGFVASFLGFILFDILGINGIIFTKIFSGIMFIILGLYFQGIGFFFLLIESFFSKFLYIINILIKKINFSKQYKPFLIGILWGNIPCGLIYTALGYAISSGSLLKSSISMIFFGLGTLPSILFSRYIFFYLKELIDNKFIKFMLGSTIIVFGILNIIKVLIYPNQCH